jgi:hypothetical protein
VTVPLGVQHPIRRFGSSIAFNTEVAERSEVAEKDLTNAAHPILVKREVTFQDRLPEMLLVRQYATPVAGGNKKQGSYGIIFGVAMFRLRGQ